MSRTTKSWRDIAKAVVDKCISDSDDDEKKNQTRKLEVFFTNYFKLMLGEDFKISSLGKGKFEETKKAILDLVEKQGWNQIQDCFTLKKWEHLYRIREQNYKNQLNFFRGMGDISVEICKYKKRANSEEYRKMYVQNTYRNDTYERIEKDFDEWALEKKDVSMENDREEETILDREEETILSEKQQEDIFYMLYPKDSTYEERREIVRYIGYLVDRNYIETYVRESHVRPRESRRGINTKSEEEKELINFQTRDRILGAIINKDDSGFQEDFELQEIYSICKKKLKERSIDVKSREAEELVLTEIKNFKPPWLL